MPRVALTDDEKRMLDGSEGAACRKAMQLLVRYADALGAERFVDTRNIAGVPGASNPLLDRYFRDKGPIYDAIFSFFDLDSDELVDVPKFPVGGCHLQGGVDPENWETLGASEEALEISQASENYAADHGVQILKTCTPYLAGNVPERGEHCAWMESSAVVYCNSVLGAKTNTEGRESTSAAMLTGKIPDWGFHRDDYRRGTHRIEVEVPVENVMDWGMLGYFVGDAVQENIPVISGRPSKPALVHYKHFGAAAASSGGVEMYHIAGITPEAESEDAAFGGRKPVDTLSYGKAERRQVYERLNARGNDENVDYVMLGCPHYSIDQLEYVSKLLDGKRINDNCRLWIFTSRAVRAIAESGGYAQIIRDAGGVLLSDTCSAIGQAVPPGTRVAALDSAKQTHYLPAIMGIEAWFGSTDECIDAAISGRWRGRAP
jgi:predicted aconitase